MTIWSYHVYLTINPTHSILVMTTTIKSMEYSVITNDLVFPEGPIAFSDGSIIVVEICGKTLKRVSPDGSQTVIAKLNGGPNGAAMGPDNWCYICNSGGWEYEVRDGKRWVTGQSTENGWIERVHLDTGEVQRLYESAGNIKLRSPNDIVFDKEGGFWFTDYGKTHNRKQDVTSVFYAKADGSHIKEVIFPLMTPNGIGLSPDEKTLYVAETRTRNIWGFDISKPGIINKLQAPSNNGGWLVAGLEDDYLLDSMAIDSAGNICVAAVRKGGIVEISPDGKTRNHYPLPDFFTTNICFGGSDLKTAYATLSGSGRLVAFEWPRPGIPLNFYT